MAWSTRELAQLAGTTVNTVRHYHALGLLDEPERRFNGYKQYRVSHLVTLIRTRRLVELGVPLAQITDVDAVAPHTARELDSELASEIDRLGRMRADVAAIARARAPLDTPRGFEVVVRDLSTRDRAFLQLYARLGDGAQIAELRAALARETATTRRTFDRLDNRADDLAQRRLAREIARARANWRAVTVGGPAGHALAEARQEYYNAAQRAVISRAETLSEPDAPVSDAARLGS